MKKEYVTPMMTGEKFVANEYVAACWGVGCDVTTANDYEQTHYYNYNKTWADIGCSHALAHCGNSGNQVIYDVNNDGVADKMKEVGTDGLGNLDCTIYSDGNYTTIKDIADVKIGQTIYWTTSATEQGGYGKPSITRIWHHVGTVYQTVPGHPNRS